MFNKFRLSFKHYSKSDLGNWFSILFLLLLVRGTALQQLGEVFAWGLFMGSLFWLVFLHYEIDSIVSIWQNTCKETSHLEFSANFQNDLKKSTWILWSHWLTLFFADWVGLFMGIVALGATNLSKLWTIPFFIISIAGIGATVIYYFVILYRSARFNRSKAIFE
jgi:hypothetical protein